MAEAERPTTGAHLLEMARGYQPAALLIGLVELDICTTLAQAGEVGLSVEELATRQSLQPRPLEALLQAATALGLLKEEAGRYVNTPLAAEYLARDGSNYLGAQIGIQADQYRGWLALPQAVREGRTVLPNLQSAGGASDDPALRRLLLGLHRGGQGLLPILTPLLDPYLKTAGRLLDVGSGVGTFGVGWAEQYGGLEVTLLDRPGVIEFAHEIVGPSPVLARVQFWPGDYHEVDFGQEVYDLVLFFQVLRTESARHDPPAYPQSRPRPDAGWSHSDIR